MGYNFKIVKYADNSIQLRYYSNVIHSNDSISEKITEKRLYTISQNEKKELVNKWSEQVSKSRTIKSIYEIARSNIWEYFITMTFNPKYIDRTDYPQIIEKVGKYFKDLKRKYGKDLKYFLVPELHKDGKSWHIHGLIANCENIPMIDSGIITKNKQKVYNLPLYEWGFTSATKIYNQFAVCSYITKYITKELVTETKGRNRFLASQNCNKANIQSGMIAKHELDNYIKKNLDKLTYSKQVGDNENYTIYVEFKDVDIDLDFIETELEFEEIEKLYM